MDPLVIVLLALAVSMTPCIWFWALWCLVWGWGRPLSRAARRAWA